MNEGRPMLSAQRQKCRPLTLVSSEVKFFANIRRGSGEGASNDSGVIENVDFHCFLDATSSAP